MQSVLFDDITERGSTNEDLGPGTAILRGFALNEQSSILDGMFAVAGQSPFRHMVTPSGFRMSVAMTNCGSLGWVTDRRGYRYDKVDRDTNAAWPAMPKPFIELAMAAAAAAGFPDFMPDACLVNRYEPSSRLTLHQDKNERDFSNPIVSVSLGLSATFLFGGLERGDRTIRLPITHGDVLVWGGPARLRYHGIMPLKEGVHPLTGAYRFNLTFRKAA
jgi:alkylated DNA repair protein (DNA oxidative demethylase)